MQKNTDPTTVFLVSENKTVIDFVRTVLTPDTGFHLLGSAVHNEKTVETLWEKQPAIVLLDSNIEDDNSLLRIDEIASQYTKGVVITLLPEKQVKLSDQVILAGARAIIYYPFTETNLLVTLRRMQELITRNISQSTEAQKPIKPLEQGTCLAFYSSKGGVGCTTLVVNAAIALHQELKKNVLVIDGKNSLGHVALMLNLRTANSMADLTTHAEKLDDSLIDQVIVKHYSGISILASPLMISKGHEIHPEELFKVLSLLKTLYPIILVDAGNYLDNNTVTYMDMSEHIFLVVNPNIASLRDARQFMDLSDSLSYSKDKIHPILSQAGRKTEIKGADIEKALRTKLFGIVPVDEEAVLSSLNEGLPIILKKAHHPISKAIIKIANSIVPMLQGPATKKKDKSGSDVLSKSSYFG